MEKIERLLAQQAQQNPAETFRVIVRVMGEMDACQQALAQSGFTITQRLRLIHGFGATVLGECLLAAQDHDWIISIEPDTEMRTMMGEN